jgi:hypothetical protein
MFSAARNHLVYRLANVPTRTYPFPHIVIDDVFPAEFYAAILNHLPPNEAYVRLRDTGRVSNRYSPQRLAYFPDARHERGVSSNVAAFWQRMFTEFQHPDIGAWFIAKFYEAIAQRFGLTGRAPNLPLANELFLMRDLESYSLGPHTDSPKKVVTVLFYLPATAERTDLGTSIYTPKDPSFACAGGPHHPVEQFERVTTVPFKPNTMLAFPKTSNCFHGVEPVIGGEVRRDVLLYDLKLTQPN